MLRFGIHLNSMQVRIQNQKQDSPLWWRVVPSVLILTVAIYGGYKHWWLLATMCVCNSMFWLTQPQRSGARRISTITLDEDRLVIGYLGGKEMVIAVGEIDAVVKLSNKLIIRFFRNEEVQHFELGRSEFDEDSWQQIRRLKNRIGI